MNPPVDSTVPPDSTAPPPRLPIPPGIVFAAFDLDNWLLNEPFNGSFRLPGPEDLDRLFTGLHAKGGRVVIQLSDHDRTVQNSDRTFSLARWKAKVDRFAHFNFDPYIEDGTLIGIMLLDEPDDPSNWGRAKIPQRTIEEMAKYSKRLFPKLTTFVRSKPSYLAAAGIKYHYLDAGWTMYESWRGDPRSWIKSQVALARRAGLGLVVGLNLLNGGTHVSGIKGTKGKFYSMSAGQIRKWGAIMLDEPYACAFFAWKYSRRYNQRSDVKRALDELRERAEQHKETSCRQD